MNVESDDFGNEHLTHYELLRLRARVGGDLHEAAEVLRAASISGALDRREIVELQTMHSNLSRLASGLGLPPKAPMPPVDSPIWNQARRLRDEDEARRRRL